jgi:hypothetical protein
LGELLKQCPQQTECQRLQEVVGVFVDDVLDALEHAFVVEREVEVIRARPISTTRLNPLRDLHLWPINLVVYQGPLGSR